MESISREANLSQIYTNHSIRATAVTVLEHSNIEARHITRASMHKSESSIRSYARRLSENKQREISQLSIATTVFARITHRARIANKFRGKSDICEWSIQ